MRGGDGPLGGRGRRLVVQAHAALLPRLQRDGAPRAGAVPALLRLRLPAEHAGAHAARGGLQRGRVGPPPDVAPGAAVRRRGPDRAAQLDLALVHGLPRPPAQRLQQVPARGGAPDAERRLLAPAARLRLPAEPEPLAPAGRRARVPERREERLQAPRAAAVLPGPQPVRAQPPPQAPVALLPRGVRMLPRGPGLLPDLPVAQRVGAGLPGAPAPGHDAARVRPVLPAAALCRCAEPGHTVRRAQKALPARARRDPARIPRLHRRHRPAHRRDLRGRLLQRLARRVRVRRRRPGALPDLLRAVRPPHSGCEGVAGLPVLPLEDRRGR
mmetsp:Transcript_9795/g.29301  ORF Transcript_9795/g.29301 Transcript_9795/m.29301 type:complete len:327 (+) Transcript_9795:1691-2671(+)